MLFNSVEYLVFLPIVFLAHWLVFKSVKARNLLIIAASYLFYGWWSWKFLLLILITTICSYVSGIAIGLYESKKNRKLLLLANIAVNLLILFTYKYFNFFADNFIALLRAAGFSPDSVTLNLVLPVGISFYTFQALSYTIDVYRGVIQPTRDITAFFAFISFFPQLVAGPIERATNLLPQFLRNRTFDYQAAVEGMKIILWGLFKKVLLADNCAAIVNYTFSSSSGLDGGLNLWWGAIAFSFQIYGDFSGYSDIAVGSARLLGIELTRNFNIPYFSTSISDFWRRWHISLQSWFRDYVYIPLGGSRKGKMNTVRNTALVFLLSGLWHGANWTFVTWGAYHSLLFMPGIMWHGSNSSERTSQPSRLRLLGTIVLTFLLVTIGWIIFRSETLGDTGAYIYRMFTDFHYYGIFKGRASLLAIVILVFGEILSKGSQHPFKFPQWQIFRYRLSRWSIYVIFYLVIIMFSGNKSDFIYFQF